MHACHMNMRMSHAWSGHVMCMLSTNACAYCAHVMHVGENRSSYSVGTSELIFSIPYYVWAQCVTSPSYTSICCKIQLNSDSKYPV